MACPALCLVHRPDLPERGLGSIGRSLGRLPRVDRGEQSPSSAHCAQQATSLRPQLAASPAARAQPFIGIFAPRGPNPTVSGNGSSPFRLIPIISVLFQQDTGRDEPFLAGPACLHPSLALVTPKRQAARKRHAPFGFFLLGALAKALAFREWCRGQPSATALLARLCRHSTITPHRTAKTLPLARDFFSGRPNVGQTTRLFFPFPQPWCVACEDG